MRCVFGDAFQCVSTSPHSSTLGAFGGIGVLTLAGRGATRGIGVGAYELRGATGATLGVGETKGKGGIGAERYPERL